MQKIKKILCVTDLSEVSKNAEIVALRLKNLLQADLTVLSCGEYYSHVPNNYLDDNLIQPHQDLSRPNEYFKFVEQKKLETVEHFKNIGYLYSLDVSENIEYEVKLENEVTATIDTIEERRRKFDLIIVGKQQTGFWERLLFGSPAKEICDESHLSTLLMPSDETWQSWLPESIVVASSLDQRSEVAEGFSAQLAVQLRAELTLLHVLDTTHFGINMNISHVFPIEQTSPHFDIKSASEAEDQCTYQIKKIEQKLRENTNIKNIKTDVQTGKVGDTIMQYIHARHRKDLLVIGSRGENALKKFFLGSKTDVIQEACTVPLIVVQNAD